MPERCSVNNERECMCYIAISNIETRVTELERWKENSRQFHEDFYNWQRKQIARDSALDVKIDSMLENINKLVKWKEEEYAKPKKLADKMTETAVAVIITAVITAILVSVGLK